MTISTLMFPEKDTSKIPAHIFQPSANADFRVNGIVRVKHENLRSGLRRVVNLSRYIGPLNVQITTVHLVVAAAVISNVVAHEYRETPQASYVVSRAGTAATATATAAPARWSIFIASPIRKGPGDVRFRIVAG